MLYPHFTRDISLRMKWKTFCLDRWEKRVMKNNNFVSESYIKAIMSQAEYDVIDGLFDKTTIVSAKMPNGFVIVASSGCVDPENYSSEIGIRICKKEIESKLWELEGYALAERLYKGQ